MEAFFIVLYCLICLAIIVSGLFVDSIDYKVRKKDLSEKDRPQFWFDE